MGGNPVSPFPMEVQTLAVNMCEVVREPFSDRGWGVEPGTVMGPEHIARTPKGARHLYSSALKFELVSKFWSDVAGCQHRYVFTHVRTCELYARAANKKRRFGCRPSVRAEHTRLQCARRTWTRTSGRFLSTAACRPNRSLRQNPSVPSAGFPIRVVKGGVKGSALGQRNVHDLLKLTQS